MLPGIHREESCGDEASSRAGSSAASWFGKRRQRYDEDRGHDPHPRQPPG